MLACAGQGTAARGSGVIERVLMIHYTPPGVTGGVEQIMRQHATLLGQRGLAVDIVAGRTSQLDLPVHVIPELNVASPANGAIEHELAAGVVSPRFHAARRSIARQLAPHVVAADAVIVHNAFTLHFNLPLTAVLWQIAGTAPPGFPVVAWSHDLAWVNPLYVPAMHRGYPWDLLRVPAPAVRYVTISTERRRQLEHLWNGTNQPITVVPNGVDVCALWRLSDEIREIVGRYGLLEADLILSLPVRITRRKNIEMAVRAVRVLKDQGLRVRFVVSGPTAAHHPERSRSYLQELKALCAELNAESEVIFLSDDLGIIPDDAQIAQLLSLSDCLLFPSASEGFGLPILEAGALGVPAVLSDIPIFQEVGANDASYFALDDDPSLVADTILQAVDTPAGRLRRRVRHEYRWEVILDRLIMPLLSSDFPPPTQESA